MWSWRGKLLASTTVVIPGSPQLARQGPFPGQLRSERTRRSTKAFVFNHFLRSGYHLQRRFPLQQLGVMMSLLASSRITIGSHQPSSWNQPARLPLICNKVPGKGGRGLRFRCNRILWPAPFTTSFHPSSPRTISWLSIAQPMKTPTLFCGLVNFNRATFPSCYYISRSGRETHEELD
jgi:hypothetical protein